VGTQLLPLCPCFDDACGPVYLPPPDPEPVPTVLISGPQGVAQGGSDVFTVTVSGALFDGPVTINLLNPAQGAGSATFADGTTSTTIDSAGTSNLTVNGVQASSTANNIILEADYGDSSAPLTSQQFSVVWVTISLQATNPPIENDAELAQFQGLVGGSAAAQGGLGAEIFYNGSTAPFGCSVGIELVGTVTPSNYPGLVSIFKSIVGAAIFDGQNPDTTGMAGTIPRPDNIASTDADNVVGAGRPGMVFDLDPPGVGAVSSDGAPERFRTNFQAYATLGDFGSVAPQASAVFPYSVAVSCGGTLDAPALDPTYFANGDNSASGGTINLTYNLKPPGQ
jgi:hypothetical protein